MLKISNRGIIHLLSDHEPIDAIEKIKEPMKIFHQSAEEGNAEAQYRLGLAYSLGHGVKMDYEEAVKWLMKSATRGYVKAQFYLGYFYSTGKGVVKDSQIAYGWLLLADKGGDDAASSFLDCMKKMLSPAQEESARKWVENWKPSSPALTSF